MNEGRIHRDFRVEKKSLGACTPFNFGSLTDCGQTLVMGQPMHIAVGSLAPQNGFAAGLAFVEHKNFSNEIRTTYDIDALATPNGSWRAGGYMKAIANPAVSRIAPPTAQPVRPEYFPQAGGLLRTRAKCISARPYHLRVQ